MDTAQDNTGIADEPVPAGAACSCISDCAGMLKVLSDANRLMIVRALNRGPANVGDLARLTGLPAQRISHHLSIMRLADLVSCERDGRTVVYRIHADIACESGLDFGCCRISFRNVVL
jgi:ArsR family transcriptional regulator